VNRRQDIIITKEICIKWRQTTTARRLSA